MTLMLVLPVVAQQRGKVTFSLIDAQTKAGIMGAVVEVSQNANPDNRRHYTSGYGGAVEISGLNYGEYTMTATFLGYGDVTQTFKVVAATLSLGTIEMKESSTRIETVVKEVQALRASQSGDTLSYNAGAFKVSADADVEGLLKKMPGITFNNGSVEAQGETIKKIFVDGKEFFGEDVNTAIKSLPAEAVDRVEVFNKLSDQAEFSGMDDGEGYKAINIVTKTDMRQGQFGKMYAGYGYQPDADDVTSNHKYTVGGNVNFFQGDSRVSVIGLFNNINQQNFSFEDILGVTGQTGGGGGRGRGVGQYMVRPQNGVALVNSIGLNYSDVWGRKDQVKFQGSYFFNNTDTKNLSESDTWYEHPSPIDTLHTEGRSRTINGNHRINARLDWKISRNQSLMSRTSFSYQSNDPTSTTYGYQYGESGLLYQQDYKESNYSGIYFNEFLQYRVKLGKPGRTLSVDGRFTYRDRQNERYLSSNQAMSISPYQELYDQYFGEGKDWYEMAANPTLYSPVYQHIMSPTRLYEVRGTVAYNEPLSQSSQMSIQYRFGYEDEQKDQDAFYTNSTWGDPTANSPMTRASSSGYWTHRVGPGFRYSKNKNTIVANVYYQRSSLDGNISGGQKDDIRRTFNNVTYFGMLNYAFNRENTIRMFFRSGTDAPEITQLQNIFDVSQPQYLSIGNKNLNPSFMHRINFHYVHSNLEKGRTFMWMFMMQNYQNYISSSTLYCPTGFELSQFGNIEIPTNSKGENYTPQRITSYENMNGYWNLRTHVSFGLPLNFMKCNLNMTAGVNYNIIPSAVYESLDDMVAHKFTTNYAKNIGYDASVTLGSNISENIDFTLSWNGTYNQAWNTAAKNGGKNNYFSHTASGSLKWVFWKGFTFTAACSYIQYIGFTNDYNESYVLCNLYLGKKVFRNQRGEIQIGVNDVANQNTAFVRNTGSAYTQNLRNSVIGRYFSIQFVYNLRHFGKRGSKQAKDYDYVESKGSVGMSNGNAGTRPYGFGRR